MADATLKMMLPTASTGKVRKVISASWASIASRITITPTSVSTLETMVTIPSVTSVSRAWTSLVIREISTPGRLRV